MSAVFLKILYMSAAGSAAIVLALLLRFAFRRGAKWIPLLLWGVVGLRLLMPFFLESGLGVLPGPEKLNEAFSAATAATVTAAPAEASAPAGIDQTEAAFTLPPEATARPATERPNETPLPSLSAELTEAAKTTAKPAAVIGGTSEGGSPWLKTAGFIWAAGVSIMLAYAAASYFALRKKLMTATVCGGAYESEFIETPFLLGVFRPRIYVPYGLSERQRQHVLAHERAHIRALDQVWKPLGFAALALHWFNPLCWLAFALFSKDLELACDERAAAGLSNNERADYCQTVLELSAKSRKLAAFPLSFGEAGAKERIKNLMNYKKMKLWAAALAVLSAALLCGCFLKGKQKKEEPRFMTITEAVSLADENGWVVVEGPGRFAAGEEKWNEFLEKTGAGEEAEIVIVTERDRAIGYGKYKDLPDTLGARAAMFKKVGFDGEIYSLAESFVWPEDYGELPDCIAKEYGFLICSPAVSAEGASRREYALSSDGSSPAEHDSVSPLGVPYGFYPLFGIEEQAAAEETPAATAEPTPSPTPDAVAFSNPVIEAAVRGALGLEETEPLTLHALSGITYLYLTGAEITDLTDLKWLTGLDELAISDAPNARLSTLPELPRLKSLTVARCGLNDVSFLSAVPSLVSLELFDNDITDVSPIAELNRLRRLDIENNLVSDITPLYGHPTLSEAALSWNPVSSEQVERLREYVAAHGSPEYSLSVSCYTADRGSIISWPMDLDGDGREEYFCVRADWLEYDFISFAWLESGEGRRLSDTVHCGTGHVAYTTLALVSSPEYGLCLMHIYPEWQNQNYSYELFDLVNGKLEAVFSEEGYHYEFEDPEDPTSPTTAPIDPEAAAEYEARVNALLASGRILITTDRWGVMERGLYDKSTGEPIPVIQNETQSVIGAAGAVGPSGELKKELLHQLFADCEVGYRFRFEPFTGED